MSWKGAGKWGQQQAWGNQKGGGDSWGQQSWGGKGDSFGGKGDSFGGKGDGWGGAQKSTPAFASAGGNKGAAKGAAAAKGGKPATPAARPVAAVVDKSAEWKVKVEKFTKEHAAQEKVTKTLLESSKVVLENEKATAGALKSSLESVEKQQGKLNDLMKEINTVCSESRRAGVSAGTAAQDLTTLLGNVRTLWQGITNQMNKLKPKAAKAAQEAEVKAKETKDAAAFKTILAKAKADVVNVENVANEVAKKATPILANPGEEGEEKNKKIAAVEAAAGEAEKKLTVCRNDLNEKVKLVLAYAPEAKKTAQAALMELNGKVAAAVKSVLVYKGFKAALPRLIENKKIIDEVSDKLNGHEGAIAKANDLSKAASITKPKLAQIEGHLDPVEKALNEVFMSLTKIRNDGGQSAKLRTKAEELKKKKDAVYTKIKGQREAIKAEEAVEQARELRDACAACWKNCQEAEMPFLMGVEVLPKDENEQALTACRDAATAADKASQTLRKHVRENIAATRVYEKELAATTATELNAVGKEIDTFEAKFTKFKKELAERKVLPMISEALDGLTGFEKKVKAVEVAGKVLAGSSLEEEAVEAIEQAVEKVKTLHKEASTAGQVARVTAKKNQREAQAKDTHPAIQQINQGLQEGHDKLSKLQQLLTKGEQVMKTKKALTEGEEKTAEAEKAADKAKKLVPKEGKKFTAESVKAFTEACAVAAKATIAAGGVVTRVMSFATAKSKPELQKLIERKNAAQAIVDEVKKDTKDAREDALGDHALAEADAKAKAVEDTAAKMEQTESPFLVGAATGTSAKTLELIEKCNEAAKEVSEAIAASRTFNASKLGEARQMGDEASKKVKEGIVAVNERVKKVATKLSTFQKDTAERAKEARLAQSTELLAELETSVKKVEAAAEPFEKEGADNMSEQDAAAPLSAFNEVEKDTMKMMTKLRTTVEACLKEQKGNEENEKTLKKSQERLKELREAIAAKKKLTAPHEKRALGTKLLTEAKEEVSGLEAEVKKATDACAALLEQGGETFLVGNSIKAFREAVQAVMKEKDQDEDQLFKTIGKGKPVAEKAFVKYLEDLAQTKDELSCFSDERKAAIFKRLASNSKGVSADDFRGLFDVEYQVMKPIAVTNKFEMDGAETVCKVEPGATVEVQGVPKEDDKHMLRAECKVGDKTGWITIKQDKAPYMRPVNAFTVFCKTMDHTIQESAQAIRKIADSLKRKISQGPNEEGLKSAREEMIKLNADVTKAQKAIEELKKKVVDGKKDLQGKENAERNAHIEAKNQKVAAPFIKDPTAKMEELEGVVKAAEEAAKPMASLSGDDLKSFATPASVLEAVEKHSKAAKEKADALRESIKEQMKAVSEVTPACGGTGLAQRTLKTLSSKLDELSKKAHKSLTTVGAKSRTLTAAKMEPTAEAIRKLAGKKGKTIEAFFSSMAKGDKIPEAAFCKMLESLEGEELQLSSELAKLVCRKLEADGVGKDAFMKFVVLYYKVVRTIAWTDAMDITKTKTIRKAEEGEVVEVLEGPATDENNGMSRVRARSLADKTEGWITVSGSKGTPFLVKATKPTEKASEETAE